MKHSSTREGPIYVAGHRGLVGSAVVRHLRRLGQTDIVTASSREVDLTKRDDVENFFRRHRPSQVVLAAAKVGGV